MTMFSHSVLVSVVDCQCWLTVHYLSSTSRLCHLWFGSVERFLLSVTTLSPCCCS